MGKYLQYLLPVKLAILLMLLCSPLIKGQILPYTDVSLTVLDGLSCNKITSLFQDSRGYLWIGTEDGLNRYDGYHVDVYRHNPFDSISISDSYVSSIQEMPDGNLWIGTRYGGLNKWIRKENRFVVLDSLVDKRTNKHEIDEVCGLSADGNDVVWVKSPGMLHRVQLDTRNVASYGHFDNVFRVDQSTRYPLVAVGDSAILVGTKDGLNSFNKISNSFSRIAGKGSHATLLQQPILDIEPIEPDRYLLATESGALLINRDASFCHRIMPETVFAGSEKINAMFRSADKTLWLATDNGVQIMNTDLLGYKSALRLFRNGIEVKDAITAIVEDRKGLLWIGTRNNGVFKYDRQIRRFQSLTSNDPLITHLESYNFTSVLMDNHNQLWLGTDGKGLYVIDKKSEKVSHYVLHETKYRQGQDVVTSLFCDSQDYVWIGTNHGIYKYNPYLGSISEFEYTGNSKYMGLLRDNSIRSIVEDRMGNIWFGTRFGLYCYTGSLIESYFSTDGSGMSLINDEVNALLVDNDGWLWIGTPKGVSIYKPSASQFFALSPMKGETRVLSNDCVLSLGKDSKGNVWIGTRTGLTRYSKASGAIDFYFVADGLRNDVINSIAGDEHDRVWVGTNNGISMISPEGFVANYFVSEGLSGATYNGGAVFKGSDGKIYFGGSEGLTYFVPDGIRVDNTLSNVSITSVKLIHQGKTIRQWGGEEGIVEMKYKKGSSLRIDFSTLDFELPHKTRFKVFLEGYDDGWQPATDQNYVTYSNLPAGDYRLKIMSSNVDTVWNNQPAEIFITVVSPLWQSYYAIGFYVILVAFLLYSFINFNVRYYRKAYHDLKERSADNQKVEAQKVALAKINRSLTDSINYAKRIQEAMLPTEEMIRQLVADSFVYFRPKDIVSGDFYYFFRRESQLYVASVDCTGHGVPGAFMSIIGCDLLRNVIEFQGLEDPGDILMALNALLRDTLKKETYLYDPRHVDVNDGMDMGLCVIDYDRKMVRFAGANHSLYVISDNELGTYDGNRMAIGSVCRGETFTTQEVELKNNDALYLFSDGYIDQFGGPEGKKFKYRRFRHLLLNIHKLPFDDQKAILHQKMEEWMGDAYEQIDDILLIGLKPFVDKKK